MEYTEEQLNYYRICYVTTDVLTEGLRSIFKQEWDSRYKTTLGEWKDEPRNGIDFHNGESPRSQKRNARLLATMINGDRAEWDCTMLFYAILHSDCIHGLNPVVQSSVDDLRKFRNEEFAHMPKGHLSDPDFQIVIGKVCAAFQALGLSTLQIQDIRNQRSFPTKELNDVLKKVDDLIQKVEEKEKELQEKGKEVQEKEKELQEKGIELQEKGKELQEKGKELHEKEKEVQEKGKELREKEEQRQVLEDQLLNEVSSFCIFPPKPSHDVSGRDCQVAEITRQLKQLKSANDSSLSYLYLSGNPGSGKSQLAGLVAKRFFDEVKEIPSATSFVMTVNAESPDTLLESYVSFARHLKCPEYAVTNTRNSENMTTDEKITNLKTLISTKVKLYTSWLLVVDNVSNISLVQVHLPDSGNEQWARGQLLITTQDMTSIPSANPFTRHISVSKGMEPRDASNLLAVLSGITDIELENEVAQALDFQPLALASAATYVKEVRQNKSTSNFGWKDYLKKLEKGQRGTTETILTETNLSYPRSMTTATTFAVENVMKSDIVLHHTFTFLSLCTPQPLSLDIVINYILNVDNEIQDKEMISMKIQRCSLLLFEEEESGVYIREHQVVHDVIRTVMMDCHGDKLLETVNGAVRSFNQYADLQNKDPHLDCLVKSKHIVPHITALINPIENLFFKQDIHQVVQSSSIYVQDYPRYFQRLGKMCEKDCAFEAARKYFDLALEFIQRGDIFSDVDLADAHCYVGGIHHALGNFHQAEKYYEHQLAIYLKELGPEHVDVARTYSNLGVVHSEMGDLEPAKEYHKRALAIRLKRLGPEHVDVARTYSNLGAVYSDLDDLEQAKECLERALVINLKRLGPEHVDVALTYSNLGIVYSDLGDLEQAKDYHERALDIYLKRLGPEHVHVALTYSNLGAVYGKLGDLGQAKDFNERALDIYLKRLGPEHVDVARTYRNLGTVYGKLGDLEQAKDFYERALAIYLKRLGPEHVDVTRTYSNLGAVYGKLGDLEQAKDFNERALTIYLKRLGPEHVDVARTYSNLGAVYGKLGDLERAKEYHERSLAIYLKRLGPEHVYVAFTVSKLAAVHRDLGDLDKAKEYDDRALAIRQKRPGPKQVDVATSCKKTKFE